jgi:hypothetical protein
MGDYVIPLDDPAAADADCVGPKAANLAALARAVHDARSDSIDICGSAD